MTLFTPFGEKIKFCEPYWYQGNPTPYYNETHVAWRAKCREFVEKEVLPYVDEWEASEYPKSLHLKAYEYGIQGSLYPVEYGGTPPVGFDAFHKLITGDELSRTGAGGILNHMAINSMALPPIINYGSKFLKDLVLRDVIEGRKFASLAISEPSAGSDVAGIKATAIKDPSGQFYIINGQKKWITGGLWADFFVTLVRTGVAGMKGLSFILIPKDVPGLSVRRMELQGSNSHNTTFVTLENVKVPITYLIGNENEGFKYTVHNFNNERLVIAVGANRSARVCYQEAIKHALTRKTFGKLLIEHQVIRHKLAEMARLIESTHDMIERIAFAFSKGAVDNDMGGACAMAKVQASTTFEFCAREASQIFGGSAIVKEGKGRVVERLYREVRASAIPGGSEEILRELIIKEALKPLGVALGNAKL